MSPLRLPALRLPALVLALFLTNFTADAAPPAEPPPTRAIPAPRDVVKLDEILVEGTAGPKQAPKRSPTVEEKFADRLNERPKSTMFAAGGIHERLGDKCVRREREPAPRGAEAFAVPVVPTNCPGSFSW